MLRNGHEEGIPVTELNIVDEMVVKHDEMIAADALLLQGVAMIEQSFVTGESQSVLKRTGEIIHAGGKQCGGNMASSHSRHSAMDKHHGRHIDSFISRIWKAAAVTGGKFFLRSFAKNDGSFTGKTASSFIVAVLLRMRGLGLDIPYPIPGWISPAGNPVDCS